MMVDRPLSDTARLIGYAHKFKQKIIHSKEEISIEQCQYDKALKGEREGRREGGDWADRLKEGGVGPPSDVDSRRAASSRMC
jgi:hypothetical protein